MEFYDVEVLEKTSAIFTVKAKSEKEAKEKALKIASEDPFVCWNLEGYEPGEYIGISEEVLM